jgi:hypothetical protein
MGQNASTESNGVTCADCGLRLPANNWSFELTNHVYYFFDKQEGGKAVVKYLRRQGAHHRYNCFACVRKNDPTLFKEAQIYAYVVLEIHRYTGSGFSTNFTLFYRAGKATLFIPKD